MIQYFDVDGKRRREKVGRQCDAISKYDKLRAQIRLVKSAKRAGVWVNDPKVGATLGELIDDALLFVADHKDHRNYVGKGEIVRTALGDQAAASITPLDIDAWLRKRLPRRLPRPIVTKPSSRFVTGRALQTARCLAIRFEQSAIARNRRDGNAS